MERFDKNKIPKCVKTLLYAAGYDSLLSLKCVNESRVKEIEDFVNSNKTLVDKLECCYSVQYKALDTFGFLPGHKSIILTLPDLVKQLETSKANMKANNKSKKKKRLQTIDSFTDEELQTKLISNLMNSSARNGVKLPPNTISQTNIQDFRRIVKEDDSYCQCIFSCPFCTKKYSLIYRSYWMSSIASKHIMIHVNEQLQHESELPAMSQA